ncbi:MAG: hypothetical protein PUD92_00730 [Clostridiales bacterium]|nr:hypothetical protein [Clostridiales bacterium]
MIKQRIKWAIIAVLSLIIIGEAVYIYRNNDIVNRSLDGVDSTAELEEQEEGNVGINEGMYITTDSDETEGAANEQ